MPRDRFAYPLALTLGEPLLFVGNDFGYNELRCSWGFGRFWWLT